MTLTDLLLDTIKCRMGNRADGLVVDIGAGGPGGPTSGPLIDRGWSAILIDEEPISVTAPKVTVILERVTLNNIESLVPFCDVLCIDVDGNDYWFWQKLGRIASIVVIEYNGAFPPPERKVMPYDPDHRWDGTDYFGASLQSLASLAWLLDYNLVGTDDEGSNAVFVHRRGVSASRVYRRGPSYVHSPRWESK